MTVKKLLLSTRWDEPHIPMPFILFLFFFILSQSKYILEVLLFCQALPDRIIFAGFLELLP